MNQWDCLILGGVLLFAILFIMMPGVRYTVFGILFLLILYACFKIFVKEYNDYERGIIFRMGKFHRIAGPGWAIVIPFFEKEFQRLDVRTHMINLLIPNAFTRDDLKLNIDGIAYYNINNPDKAVLKIDNYSEALRNALVGETRNIIGSMRMRELFSNLSKLNDLLRDAIRRQTWAWGIDVPKIQLRGVMPDSEIIEAMQQKEITAQQLQAQRFAAEAKKVMIEAIGEAAENLSDRALMFFYLKALEEMGKGSGTKLIFPMKFFDVLDNLSPQINSDLKSAGIKMDENSIINNLKKILSQQK